jgi:hypothetical protein
MTLVDFIQKNKHNAYFQEKWFYNSRKSYQETLEDLKYENLANAKKLLHPRFYALFEDAYKRAELIQPQIFLKNNIQEGDCVVYKKNGIEHSEFVTVRPYKNNEGVFRLQGGGGYHHRSNHGIGDYSGTCGEIIKFSSFSKMDPVTQTAWFWASGSSQGHGGADFDFQVNRWRLL